MDATPDRSAFPWFTPDAALGMPMPGGEALGDMGKAWMQAMTALFAARLRADADTVLAMGACTTLTDLALLQQRWFTEAGQAYSDAAQRMVRIATEAAAKPAEAPTDPKA